MTGLDGVTGADGGILGILEARSDLEPYGSNAIALLSLELRFGIDDLITVADDALTDDTKDHKCDLLYVNRENGIAVLAQTYVADDPQKSEPPSNKAADLNTALTWTLDGAVPDDQAGRKAESGRN